MLYPSLGAQSTNCSEREEMKKTIIFVCALYAAEICAMNELVKLPCVKTELVENLKNELRMLDVQISDQDKLARSFEKERQLVSNILDLNEESPSPYITKEIHTGFEIMENNSDFNLEIIQEITTKLREKKNAIIQRIGLLEPSEMQHLKPMRSSLHKEIKKGVNLKALSIKSDSAGTREIPYLRLLETIKRSTKTALSSDRLYDLEARYGSKSTLVEKLKNEVMALDLDIADQEPDFYFISLFSTSDVDLTNISDISLCSSALGVDLTNISELREKKNAILQRIEMLDPSEMQHLKPIRSSLHKEIKKGVNLKALSVKSDSTGTCTLPYLLLLDTIKRSTKTALSPDMLRDLDARYGSKPTLVENLKNEVMALDLEIAEQKKLASVNTRNTVRIQLGMPTETNVGAVAETSASVTVETQVATTTEVSAGAASEANASNTVETQAGISTETNVGAAAETSASATVETQVATTTEVSAGATSDTNASAIVETQAGIPTETNVGAGAETSASATVETQVATTTEVSAGATSDTNASNTVETNAGATTEKLINGIAIKKFIAYNRAKRLDHRKNELLERIELLEPSEMQHLKSVRSDLLKEIKNKKRTEYSSAMLCDWEGSDASISDTLYINLLNDIKNGRRTTYSPDVLCDLEERYDSKTALLRDNLKSQVMMLALNIGDQEALAQSLEKEMCLFKDILHSSDSPYVTGEIYTALDNIKINNAFNLEKITKLITELCEKKNAMLERIELLGPSEMQHLKSVRSDLLKEIKNKKRTEYSSAMLCDLEGSNASVSEMLYMKLLNEIKNGQRRTYSPEILCALDAGYDSKAAFLMDNLKCKIMMYDLHISDQEKLAQSIEKELSLLSNILDPNRGSSYTRDEMNAALEMARAEKAHNGESPFDVLTRLMQQKKSQREEVKKMIKELVQKQNMVIERIKILDPSEMEHLKAARAQLLIAIKEGIKLKPLPVITDNAIAREMPYILLLKAIKDRKQTIYSQDMLCDVEARYDSKPTLVENLKNKIMMLELQILDNEGLARFHETKYQYYSSQSALSDLLISMAQQKKLHVESAKEALKELCKKKNAMLKRIEMLDPSEKEHLKRDLLPLLKSIRQGVKLKSLSVRIAREDAKQEDDSAENDDNDVFSDSTDSDMNDYLIQGYYGEFGNKQNISVQDAIEQGYEVIE